ncbi:MAG: SIS domain-containing protein, partial [Anaerolineae bacterium]
MFRAFALTDNVPLLTAWSNDAEYAEVFAGQLANHVEPGDVVIGISTSGESENVLRALVLAREYGAVTVGFTGDHGGQLRDLVDWCVFVPSGHIGRQEDVHLALDHVITSAIKARLQHE